MIHSIPHQNTLNLPETIARAAPNTRIRFTSPHPKDFPAETLEVIRNYPNICKSIHLPAQSGNSAVLDRMRRGYTREAYMELVNNIRESLPGVSLSSDFICGFCGETDEEFADTLSLMETVKYNVAYLFAYSMREKTTAHRRYKDDVPDEVKNARLKAMVKVFREGAAERNAAFIGKNQQILIEGVRQLRFSFGEFSFLHFLHLFHFREVNDHRTTCTVEMMPISKL